MAIATAVKNVVTASRALAPKVAAGAQELIAKATNGKVTDLSGVAKYVGSSPERLSVVTGAMVRAGALPDDLVPEDLTGRNAQLAAIRATLLKTAATMQQTFDAGSDRSLNTGIDGDILRKERVKTALRVFGSERAYFLCNPTGGIPREDFAWYAALFNRT